MDRLNPHDITLLFLTLGLLLATARVLGEIAERLNQPSILGELMAGILLGPTVLGTVYPEWNDLFFPKHGGRAFAFDGLMSIFVTMFLLVAGIEVDLSSIWKQGRTALVVSLSGITVPFALGFGAAWFVPELMGMHAGADHKIFVLFFATALSITALPVIAKTLLDLNLFHSDLGMVTMAAATFDDLVGWIIFSIVLGLMGSGASHGPGIPQTIALMLTFVAVALTAGRWFVNLALPWIQAHCRWPSGVLSFALALAFFGAAFTESIGIHPVFGAFIVGVAIGDSRHLRGHTKTMINQFISSIFAPIFFASIGLRVNFAANFDLLLCVVVFVIASIGKVIGCGSGALLSGVQPREAWSLGFAMNARGIMEIVLGLLALQHHIIDERMFVALVVMSLLTSMLAGPMLQRLLQRRKAVQFVDYIWPKAFIQPLTAIDRESAIADLSRAAASVSGIDAEAIRQAVAAREDAMPTGLGDGLAVPHARLAGLTTPLVVVGISPGGVDFDSADGEPAQIIFLVLTPVDDSGAQIQILSDFSKTFRDPRMREKVKKASGYTEFLALLKSDRSAEPENIIHR